MPAAHRMEHAVLRQQVALSTGSLRKLWKGGAAGLERWEIMTAREERGKGRVINSFCTSM